jgi:hypothetical protein
MGRRGGPRRRPGHRGNGRELVGAGRRHRGTAVDVPREHHVRAHGGRRRWHGAVHHRMGRHVSRRSFTRCDQMADQSGGTHLQCRGRARGRQRVGSVGGRQADRGPAHRRRAGGMATAFTCLLVQQSGGHRRHPGDRGPERYRARDPAAFTLDTYGLAGGTRQERTGWTGSASLGYQPRRTRRGRAAYRHALRRTGQRSWLPSRPRVPPRSPR